MKLSIHIEGATLADAKKDLNAQAAILFGASPATTTGKAGKKTKPKEEEEEFDLADSDEDDDADSSEDESDDSDSDEDETDDADSDDDEDDSDTDDDEEEAPPKKNSKATDLTLQDVIAAFQKYAKKTSREKAGKVLAKFKVKGVKELKKTDYSKAIAALK